jgi:hypothetical protein
MSQMSLLSPIQQKETWLRDITDLYSLQQPRSRLQTPVELVRMFRAMQTRAYPFEKINERNNELRWIPSAIKQIEDGGCIPVTELIQLDATMCWLAACWAAAEQVADQLVASGVLPRHYFNLAQHPPDSYNQFGHYGSNWKSLKANDFDLIVYLHNHCALHWYCANPNVLPSEDILYLPWYSRPLQWLGEGCQFGKVSRVQLEQALTAVPAIGFVQKCHRECHFHERYDYYWGTSWIHRAQRLVRRLVRSRRGGGAEEDGTELKDPVWEAWDI